MRDFSVEAVDHFCDLREEMNGHVEMIVDEWGRKSGHYDDRYEFIDNWFLSSGDTEIGVLVERYDNHYSSRTIYMPYEWFVMDYEERKVAMDKKVSEETRKRIADNQTEKFNKLLREANLIGMTLVPDEKE